MGNTSRNLSALNESPPTLSSMQPLSNGFQRPENCVFNLLNTVFALPVQFMLNTPIVLSIYGNFLCIDSSIGFEIASVFERYACQIRPLLDKVQQSGMLQEPLGWGDVWSNSPEFTWLISCAGVSDHFSFQCPKPMSFGYLYAVGSGELIVRLVEQTEL